MSDIDFKCPACAQDLQAPTSMSGETIDCPNCTKPLIVPAIQPSTQRTYTPPQKPKLTIPKGGLAGATSQSQTEKPCPMCGESILAVAKKCKHCGSMLDGTQNAQNVTVTGKDPFAEYHTPIQGKKKGKLTFIGICGIGFGILAMVASISGCLVGNNPNAGEGLLWTFLVGLGFMVASSLWARK